VSRKQTLPEVTVVAVPSAPSVVEIALPGSIQAITEVIISARAEGYIRRWMADIGDRVREKDLLAEIESPEVDQQLRQAEAMLQRSRSALGQAEAGVRQTRANLELAEVTLRRWKELVERGVLSQQDGDEKNAVYRVRQADVAAAEAGVRASQDAIRADEANVHRLLDIQSFQRVQSPFGGVITARSVEVGSLVGSSGGASRELFRLAEIDHLRVLVHVPQSDVGSIRVGQECVIQVREHPGDDYVGRVSRTASTLDASSRTLLTEVRLPNSKKELLPGMYADVHFKIRRTHPPLLIPSGALITGDSGPQVALLQQDQTVHFQKVRVGRDYGAQMEIVSGLQLGDTIVTNPTDEIRPGSKVKGVALGK
jgi:RND family efflux transporter MFP subunit